MDHAWRYPEHPGTNYDVTFTLGQLHDAQQFRLNLKIAAISAHIVGPELPVPMLRLPR
jgi:hypothetical protein